MQQEDREPYPIRWNCEKWIKELLSISTGYTLHLHFLPVAPGGRWHYYYIFCYISYIIGLEAGFIGWVYSRFPASDESMEWVSVFPRTLTSITSQMGNNSKI